MAEGFKLKGCQLFSIYKLCLPSPAGCIYLHDFHSLAVGALGNDFHIGQVLRQH